MGRSSAPCRRRTLVTVTGWAQPIKGNRVPNRADMLVAGGLLVAGLVEAMAGGEGGNRIAYAVGAVAATVPLVWRRVRPGLVAIICAVVIGPPVLLPTRTDDLLVVFVALVVALFSLGLHADRRQIQVGLIATLLLVVAPIPFSEEGADDAVYVALLVAIVVVPARLLRRRLAEVAQLTERSVRAEAAAAESAKAAAAAERNRLAREMHDIIGHGVSLMVVHAAAAETHLNEPDVARRSLQAVQETGRQAVADLARLLGLLRDEHAEIGLAPQPGLGDLERLVAKARDGGDKVTLGVVGEVAHAPPTAALAAYRVAQEGLTNARRHSPGAPVTVSVDIAERAVRVRVVNDCPPEDRSRAPKIVGSGAGVAGLRERIALFHGTVTAQTRDDGGFVLDATVPFDGSNR